MENCPTKKYLYCQNDPVNKYDPLGLMTIPEWDSLSQEKKQLFYQNTLGPHRRALQTSAKSHDVPHLVLAAIVLTEQVDQTPLEEVTDRIGAIVGYDTSVGLAQVNIRTAMKYRLVPDVPTRTRARFIWGAGLEQIQIVTPKQRVLEQLLDPAVALDAAGKYIRDVMCANAARGQTLDYNRGPYSRLYDLSLLSGPSSDWPSAWLGPHNRDWPHTPFDDDAMSRLGMVVQLLAAAYTSPPFYEEGREHDGWDCLVEGFLEYKNWGAVAQGIFDDLLRSRSLVEEDAQHGR